MGHILHAKAGPRGATAVFKSVKLKFATVQDQRIEEGVEDLTLRSSVPLAIGTQREEKRSERHLYVLVDLMEPAVLDQGCMSESP